MKAFLTSNKSNEPSLNYDKIISRGEDIMGKKFNCMVAEKN